MARNNCYCCSASIEEVSASDAVRINKCRGCGSLLIGFPEVSDEADPWKMASVTPEFLEALQFRRRIQANCILDRFQSVLSEGPVLDYGCGQGAFVTFLKSKGIDASGCDISVTNIDATALGSSFLELTQPWEIPDLSRFKSVSLLDVIEHSEAPHEFVARLFDSKVRYVFVKVPMLNGPIGMLAQLLTKVGKAGLLERLLLVGEISPHFTFFSTRGMTQLFENRGFYLKNRLRIADVGSELPNRLRGKPGEPDVPAKRLLAATFGAALATVAPAWSDTQVFLFERKAALRRAA